MSGSTYGQQEAELLINRLLVDVESQILSGIGKKDNRVFLINAFRLLEKDKKLVDQYVKNQKSTTQLLSRIEAIHVVRNLTTPNYNVDPFYLRLIFGELERIETMLNARIDHLNKLNCVNPKEALSTSSSSTPKEATPTSSVSSSMVTGGTASSSSFILRETKDAIDTTSASSSSSSMVTGSTASDLNKEFYDKNERLFSTYSKTLSDVVIDMLSLERIFASEDFQLALKSNDSLTSEVKMALGQISGFIKKSYEVDWKDFQATLKRDGLEDKHPLTRRPFAIPAIGPDKLNGEWEVIVNRVGRQMESLRNRKFANLKALADVMFVKTRGNLPISGATYQDIHDVGKKIELIQGKLEEMLANLSVVSFLSLPEPLRLR